MSDSEQRDFSSDFVQQVRDGRLHGWEIVSRDPEFVGGDVILNRKTRQAWELRTPPPMMTFDGFYGKPIEVVEPD